MYRSFGISPNQDLKDLGVPLGHRRKMLAAIAEHVGIVQASPQHALRELKPQETAERRQVTVMFSDLVGSTALSARMDRETYARSYPPTRSASPRPCSGSAGS
jgi:class 3 adenylate cyclase